MITQRINPFTTKEFAWLWPRFQRCGFSPASFPKRFAKNELDRLTDKGRNTGVGLAYQYRRQIFANSAKWTWEQFVENVRIAAAKEER